jgi:hypothetical protein
MAAEEAFMRSAPVVILIMNGFTSLGVDQASPPTLYSAFTSGGPIVAGTIIEAGPGEGTGTLKFQVTEQLRGKPLPSIIELSYSVPLPNPKRPPMLWGRVIPRQGKHILVILGGGEGNWFARSVLDLDAGEGEWVPVLKRMISLEQQTKNTAALMAALSDPSPLVRQFAVETLLDRACVSDEGCREQVLDRFVAIASAQGASSNERVHAVDIIGQVFDPANPASNSSTRAVRAMFQLLSSPDPAVRGESVQILDSLFNGGGSSKPLVPDLPAAMRNAVLAQLKADAQAGRSYSAQASRLMQLVAAR